MKRFAFVVLILLSAAPSCRAQSVLNPDGKRVWGASGAWLVLMEPDTQGHQYCTALGQLAGGNLVAFTINGRRTHVYLGYAGTLKQRPPTLALSVNGAPLAVLPVFGQAPTSRPGFNMIVADVDPATMIKGIFPALVAQSTLDLRADDAHDYTLPTSGFLQIVRELTQCVDLMNGVHAP